MDTFGCFYHYPFDPAYRLRNLITYNDDGGLSLQFRFAANVISGLRYVLVVTTASPTVRGSFHIEAFGPSLINFVDYISSTSRPIRSTSKSNTVFPLSGTSRRRWQERAELISRLFYQVWGIAMPLSLLSWLLFRSSLATTPSGPVSHHVGSLSTSSSIFIRPYSSGTNACYYEAIQVTVLINGNYTFVTGSFVDTFVLLYESSFDPNSPSQNLITADKKSMSDRQRGITVSLQFNRRYVLVVSTVLPRVTGAFVIDGYGPSPIDFSKFSPSTITPTTTRRECKSQNTDLRVCLVQVHRWSCHPTLATCLRRAPCSIDLAVSRGTITFRLSKWPPLEVASILSQVSVQSTHMGISITVPSTQHVHLRT